MCLAGLDAHPPSDPFVQRARRLVDFLVLREGAAGAIQREHELAEWIAQSQAEAQAASRPRPFEPTELGIILRAINGPVSTGAATPQGNELLWTIARCMAGLEERR
jgi:hypothetical protein